jgi:hypothetical protein
MRALRVLWEVMKDPRVGFIGCYSSVAAVQILALLRPSATAYDRGFGVPWIATVISVVFFLGALGSLAGQVWPKIPLEYVFLPILSAGYCTFGIAALVAAATGSGEGYLIYGLGYFGFGSLFHARWRVQSKKFKEEVQKRSDAEVDLLLKERRASRDDTSVEATPE